MRNKVLLVSSYLMLAEPLRTVLKEKFQLEVSSVLKDAIAGIREEADSLALVIIGGGVVSPMGGLPAMLLKIGEIRQCYGGPMFFASGNPDNNKQMADAAGENAYWLDEPRDLLSILRKILQIK